MTKLNTPALRAAIVCCSLALAAGKTLAADPDGFVGSRVDKPDGSAALSLGRRLPTDWETKLGVDLQLAPSRDGPETSDPLLEGPARDRSSGTGWMNVTLPGLATPLAWDKASLDARLDPTRETGKIGTTFARSLPLGRELSVTLQDGVSLTEALEGKGPANSGVAVAVPSVAVTPPDQLWTESPSLRFNVLPTSTAVAAGSSLSNADNQWHNTLSAEQKLWGALNALDVTASITDPGSATSNRSITARFKRVW